MREEFILNIYKNDEWAPLWVVEDKAQRVLGIMKQRNETQRLGIGEGRYGETEIFAQGRGVCEFRTPQGGVRNFRTGHYSPVQMRNWILSNGHNFFVSNPNCTPFEVLDS